MTIQVKLRFFGILRELAKGQEAAIQLQENTKVRDLVEIIGERFPNLRQHLKVVSFAVDNEYADKDRALKNGDEVGLIPPISGG